MTKKELTFIISMNVVLVLINVIWALIDINTYLFVGVIALLPAIILTKSTKKLINDFKTNKEI